LIIFFQKIFPHKILFYLFLIGLILRASFVIFYVGNKGFLPIPDQIIHHHIAINFNKGNGLSFPSLLYDVPEDSPQWVKDKFYKWKGLGGFWGVVPVEKPQTSFPPVHPFYLSMVYKLFGPNPIASRLIQVVISALTTIILYHLALIYFGSRTALLTFLITIFYPYYIYYTGVLLNETLSIFFLSISLLFFAIMKESSNPFYPLLSGLFFSLLFLSRSVFLLFFPFLIVLVIIFHKGKCKKSVLLLLAFLIPIVPWVIRNYAIYDQVVIMPTKGGWNLWERNNYRLNPAFLEVEHPELRESFSIITAEDKKNLKRKELTEYPPNLVGKTEPERDKILKKAAFEFVKANPMIYAKLSYIRFFEFFRVTHKYVENNLYRIAAWMSIGMILVLGVLGGILSLKRWRELLVFYSLLGYYIGMHILTTSGPRYRLMIEFIFIFFAAHFLKIAILRFFPQIANSSIFSTNKKVD